MKSWAFVLAALLAMGGCSNREAKGGPVEIVYWSGWTGHEFDIQKGIVERFNAAHPKIHVRIVSLFGNYEKVRIAFAGDATPDVMSTVWADELAGYAKRDVLTPLDGYLKQSGRDFDKEYVPSLRGALRVDGKVYALAVTSDTEFIVYNKDAFRQAGLPDRPISTTDELRTASKACMLYRPNGSVARYGYRPTDLHTWAYVFGGQWVDSQGHVTANDPANVRALTWMQSFNQFMDPKRVQVFQAGLGNDNSADGPFYNGKIAMWQTGEWASRYLQKYAPTLPHGYFPFPIPPGGKPDTTYVNGSVFVIPKACRHKAEAWEFLDWLTQPAQVIEFCGTIGNVPPLLAVENAPVFTKDPLMRFAVKLSRSPNGVGAPGVAFWPQYVTEIQRSEDEAMLGGEDPQSVLNDLQRRMKLVEDDTRVELGQ